MITKEKIFLNKFHLLICLIVYLLLKIIYLNLDTSQLKFLLLPEKTILSFLWNKNATEMLDGSYLFDSLNIIIDKSCSGFRLLQIIFLVLSVQIILSTKQKSLKIASYPIALLASYPLTIIGNSLRIAGSRIVQAAGDIALGTRPHYRLHEISGAFSNLLFLLIVFLLTNKILQTIQYEKNS